MPQEPNHNRFFVALELTDACNRRCLHCLREVGQARHHFPLPLLKHILDQLADYRNPHLAITGGEPNLHPQFAAIIQEIVRRGFTFHLVTNGHDIARTLTSLVPAGQYLQGISLSLDGATEKTHDQIRGRGSFRQVMQAIASCRVKEIPVSCQMVVNRINRSELDEMVKLCATLGVSRVMLSHMQPTPDALKKKLMLSPEEWLAVEEEVGRLTQLYRLPLGMSAGYVDITPLANCHVLSLSALNIDCRGRLTFCCNLSGTTRDKDSSDVIADLHTMSLRQAHQIMIDKVAELSKNKISKLAADTENKLDRFICWYCQKYFDKVDWMKQFPEDPWVKGDPAYFADKTATQAVKAKGPRGRKRRKEIRKQLR